MDLEAFLESQNSTKPHFLLIGSPIGHSISPMMHNLALEHHKIPATYYPVAVKQSQIPKLIAHFNHFNFLGANITIPYKETLFDAVDSYSPEAAQIQAVNTIVKDESKLTGHNTDAYGFLMPIKPFESELRNTDALIFGTGGATKAIVYALRELGVKQIALVSRRPARYENPADDITMCSYDNWIHFAEQASIIINATPLGMAPHLDASPVEDHQKEILQHKFCYDVIYNPQKTRFLKQAEAAGGVPVGGLEMLIHQAAKSFNLWTGKDFPVSLIKQKLNEIFPS